MCFTKVKETFIRICPPHESPHSLIQRRFPWFPVHKIHTRSQGAKTTLHRIHTQLEAEMRVRRPHCTTYTRNWKSDCYSMRYDVLDYRVLTFSFDTRTCVVRLPSPLQWIVWSHTSTSKSCVSLWANDIALVLVMPHACVSCPLSVR